MSGWGRLTVRIDDDVAWTAGALRVVAIDLALPGATPYVLEASAAAVWEEIAETGPVVAATLLHRVAAAFEVDESAISADIEALIDDLVSRNLLATGAAE